MAENGVYFEHMSSFQLWLLVYTPTLEDPILLIKIPKRVSK